MPILNPEQSGGSASIPTTKVLPDGYEYRKSVDGDLQVWKVDVTPNVLITSQNVGEFDVNGSIRAAINTIYLEEAHSIKSSGEEVVFKNLESNVFFTPLWQYTSENGESVGDASILVEAPTSTEYFQNGTTITGSNIPCLDTYTTTSNGSVYQFITKAGENYSGKIVLELRNSLNKAVFREERNFNVTSGQDILFDKLLYRVRTGNVRTFSLLKADGTPLLVKSGLDTAKPWVKVIYRGFEDRKVVHVDASGKIPTSELPQIDTVERNTVVNQAARLALPISTKFRITIQTDVQRQFYLDPNLNPSVSGNWVDGGSVASAVTSFNSRTGNVTPQSGDYTAAQVGAITAPANDGTRRVLIGNVPTLEVIVDDLTTNSALQPLSAAQGKILKDSKQDTITGAASTITDNNLTPSVVAVTDTNGKITTLNNVSAAEVGYLDGVSGNIQTQLDNKQTVITGAASSVVTSNLNASSLVVTDAAGKLTDDPNVSTVEVGYLNGVTSSIQTQIDSKQTTITGTASTITTNNLTGNRVLITNPGGKAAVSSVTGVELGYSSGLTSSIQTQINSKQATITGAATTITSTNLTASSAVITDASGKIAASTTVSSTELGYLDGVTSAIQTQLNGKQATITGAATTVTTANLTANRALLSDASGKITISTVTNTELGYSSGVTKALQTQLTDDWFARNTSNILTGDKAVVDMVPIATATGTITTAMVPWNMPTTTSGRAYQFAWMLNRVGALIGSLDNDRSYDGLFSTLLSGAAADSTLMKTAWPSLGAIDVDQGSSTTVPAEAFKMILGRDSTNIYWVNVVGWFNAADDRGIRYETASNVWANSQDGTFPLVRSSTQLTAGAATFSDNLISSGWPALCVIPIRLELF